MVQPSGAAGSADRVERSSMITVSSPVSSRPADRQQLVACLGFERVWRIDEDHVERGHRGGAGRVLFRARLDHARAHAQLP